MRVAAIQQEARVADVDANLEMCERLARKALKDGAELVVLPEFFSTGIGWVPELAGCARPLDGAPGTLLRDLAREHGARVGGSFLVSDPDGHVRNAFVLAGPAGQILGRHDKDLPTMWENAFYTEGSDEGVLDAGDGTHYGVALCWELMRTWTVQRLRGRVDMVVGGSGWWSVPEWGPVGSWMERRNTAAARHAAESFARYVGAPVVHAAHAGELRCSWPWLKPLPYTGRFEGATCVVDGHGNVLASRSPDEGEGIVTAEVEPGRVEPALHPPARFWLHRRGAVAAGAWAYQRVHGRRWYARNVAPAAA